MDKKFMDKLLISPSTQTVPQSLKNTGSSTGNPRNKCALKPGHSLMDWIRLGNSGIDLSGTGGRLVSVSKEELSKHKTRNDAWIAIGGLVYNITQYLEFHPGGIEELMRGVGTDATKLFNDVHSWVNYAQLLNKCRIGPLTNTVKLDADIGKSLNLSVSNIFGEPAIAVQQADVLPRLDWIQNRENVTLLFYTKKFCNPGTLIRDINHKERRIEILIFIDLYVHKFCFELEGRIKWPPKKVEISTESGKIEINLNKDDGHKNLWSGLGKYERTKLLTAVIELGKPLEFKILCKKHFNNDSFSLSIKNDNAIYSIPIGYHITIEDFVNGRKINKCYTPVPGKYVEKYINIEMDSIYFLIKHYPNHNSFSKHLGNLKEDSIVKVSLPMGKLKLSTLAAHRKICFLSAGSGLTPFLSLIDHLLNRTTNRIEVLKLFYFNKTITDIWCNDILVNISAKDGRFEFVNILSNPDEFWPGIKGKVSSELLFPIASKSKENFSYIGVCGPSKFITRVEEILNELNFPKNNLFVF